MKRIVVHEHGGPETLTLVDGPMPEPGPKEALVANSVSGVNFIDVYYRTGLYPTERPTAIGSEGAGTVERVGSEVTEVKPGDRVVYAMARGSYAEYAVVPAAMLAPLPDDVTFEAAAAVMLQGIRQHTSRDRPFFSTTHTPASSTPRPAGSARCSCRWQRSEARG